MIKEALNLRIEQQNALKMLVGARLTSVQFVLNYLILEFDEKGALTALVWPELVKKWQSFSFGTPGYRDELCSLIEQVVQSTSIDGDEVIEIQFESGADLIIRLQACQHEGERAILNGPKHFLYVF